MPSYIFLQIGEIQSIMCVAFGPNKTTYSGTLGGDIYIWNGNTLAKVLPKVHKVPIAWWLMQTYFNTPFIIVIVGREASTRCTVATRASQLEGRMAAFDCTIQTSEQTPQSTSLTRLKATRASALSASQSRCRMRSLCLRFC